MGLRPSILAAFAITSLTIASVGQQSSVRGTIVRESGAPVHQALVTIRSLGLRALTARDGTFSLHDIPAGAHDLFIAKAGTPGKTIRLETTANAPSMTDLGTIVLDGSQPVGQLTFAGVVIDERNGNPIRAATVTVGDEGTGVTGDDGVFRIIMEVDDPSETIPVRATRIGYLPLEGSVDVAPGENEVTLRLALQVSPVELEEIVVEGEARLVPSYLKGFYERQRLASGTFYTQEEIEKLNPPRISDLLRRIPGLDVLEGGALGLSQEPTYRFSSSGFLGCVSANLFVDGVRVPAENFGQIARPERLAGIEAYRGISTPVQFDTPSGQDGSTGCGAIVAWTKPTMLEDGPAPVILNAFWGNSIRTSGRSGMRFGGHMVFNFVGPLELNPGFAIISEVGGQAGSAWQVLLNFRVRPLGTSSPFYLGAGTTVINIRPVVRGARDVGATAYPMALAGVRASIGGVQPFGEFHIVDPTRPSSADVNLLLGLGIKIGGS